MFMREAHDELMAEARTARGTTCRCCGKFAKVYPRKFNARMARTLIYSYPFFKQHPYDFLHLEHFLIDTHNFNPGDHGKLVWWAMMEKSDEPPRSGAKTSGRYCMTAKGRAFTENKLRVPGRCLEYMSVIECFYGGQVNIEDALGNAFNYRELMRSSAGQRDMFE